MTYRTETSESIAIIGAGASGSLLASQLLRRARPGTRITLIDSSGRFGPGVAYGSTSSVYRLNVCAAQMAPLPKDPENFLRWSRTRDAGTKPSDYLPRRLFGEYLSDLLAECERRAAGSVALERCAEEAVALAPTGESGKRRLTLRSGKSIEVDKVVIAVGNSTLSSPPELSDSLLGSPFYVADPRSPGILARAAADETVLLLGTGLTMIDVSLELGGPGGPVIHAVSRSGLTPRGHLWRPSPPLDPPFGPLDSLGLDELVERLVVAAVSASGRGEGWRAVIDSLRPITNDLWDDLTPVEQERFQREFARLWSIHRHRMAPQVSEAVERLVEKGRLRVRAASIRKARIRDGAVDVVLAVGRSRTPLKLRVDRIINCTGPVYDPRRIGSPFVQDLVRRGAVRPNRLGAGFDTFADGRVVGVDGRAVEGVYAIGPLRTGSLFETTAVPEIGRQARAIATEITGSDELRVAGSTFREELPAA